MLRCEADNGGASAALAMCADDGAAADTGNQNEPDSEVSLGGYMDLDSRIGRTRATDVTIMTDS